MALQFREIDPSSNSLKKGQWDPSFINERLPLDKIKVEKISKPFQIKRRVDDNLINCRYEPWNPSFINDKLQPRKVVFQKLPKIQQQQKPGKLDKIILKTSAKHQNDWNPSFINDKLAIRKVHYKKQINPKLKGSKSEVKLFYNQSNKLGLKNNNNSIKNDQQNLSGNLHYSEPTHSDQNPESSEQNQQKDQTLKDDIQNQQSQPVQFQAENQEDKNIDIDIDLEKKQSSKNNI